MPRREEKADPLPPTVLDRFLHRWAPRLALRREESRRMLGELLRHGRDYEAASTSNRTKGWRADSTDANAEIGPALEQLRNRHRQLVRDNPWAGRAVRVLVNRGVGSGIAVKSRAAGKLRARRLDERWAEFVESVESDQAGLLPLDGQVRLGFRSTVEGGESILRRIWSTERDGPGGVPFRVQLLEGDHLATDYSAKLKNGGRVLQGVELDADGRRVAYHLHSTHPGAPWPEERGSLVRVDARDLAHPFRVDRIGQARGIPWGSSAMLRLRDWDLYEDAQLLRQRIAACFVAFEHDLVGDPDTATAKSLPGYTKGSEDDGADSQHLEPGTWEKLAGGRTIEFGRPPGVEGYRDNMEINAMAVAAAYGVTYAQLTQDLSRANYSSMRGGFIEQRGEVDGWRRDLIIPRMMHPLWRWFVEGMILTGQVTPSDDVYRATFTPPLHEYLDPSVEIPAATKEIRSGFASWQEKLRQMGKDPALVLEQMAEDLAAFDEKGIALDSDGRRSQQGTPPTTGPGSDPDGTLEDDDTDPPPGDPPEVTEDQEEEGERARHDLRRRGGG